MFWHDSSAPPWCLKPPYQQSDWEKVGILIFRYEKESITRAQMVPYTSVKTALVANIWDVTGLDQTNTPMKSDYCGAGFQSSLCSPERSSSL